MGLFGKKQNGLPHHAVVYVRRDGKRVVVVTQHSNGGIWCEDDQAVVLDGPPEQTKLADAMRSALQTTTEIVRDLRKLNKTDWPAFKASKASSVQKFESEYVRVDVTGDSEANEGYVVTGWPDYPTTDGELAVTASISAHASDDEFGDLLVRVYEACRDRQL